MNIQPDADRFLTLMPPPPQPRRRVGLRLAGAVAVLIVALVGASYLYPHRVAGEVLTPGALAVELRGPGTLTALSEAVVGSRIQARVEELAVDRNDMVAKGDVLARLSFDDLAGELAAEEAHALAAEGAVLAAQADRDRAAAALEKARATHERQMALLAKGATSEAGFDDALAARRQAQADLARAERMVEQSQAERDAARARIKIARSQLDDSLLRAPLSGMVVSRARHAGEVLTPGTELLRIVDPSSLVLTARLDESALGAVRPGQPTLVTFGRAGRAITGHVLRLSREVDEETREFEIDITLDALPENWALGQRGMARITVEERHDVLAVPASLLVWRDGKPGVWVASDGRARWREVLLGPAGAQRVEIREGLSAGDTVLAPEGLRAFIRVRLARTSP